MDEIVRAEAGLPVGEVMARVIGGAVMFERAVGDVLLKQLGECVDLLVLIEFVLAEFDFVASVAHPIFGCGFSIEVIADCGVAFYADDCAPAFTVFSFVYCHSSNLWFWGSMAGLQCWIKFLPAAPFLHRKRKNLVQKGFLDQG